MIKSTISWPLVNHQSTIHWPLIDRQSQPAPVSRWGIGAIPIYVDMTRGFFVVSFDWIKRKLSWQFDGIRRGLSKNRMGWTGYNQHMIDHVHRGKKARAPHIRYKLGPMLRKVGSSRSHLGINCLIFMSKETTKLINEKLPQESDQCSGQSNT